MHNAEEWADLIALVRAYGEDGSARNADRLAIAAARFTGETYDPLLPAPRAAAYLGYTPDGWTSMILAGVAPQPDHHTTDGRGMRRSWRLSTLDAYARAHPRAA